MRLRDPQRDDPSDTENHATVHLAIELRAEDGQPVTVEAADGEVHPRPDKAEQPDLVMSEPQRAIVGLLAGRYGLKEAKAAGVSLYAFA